MVIAHAAIEQFGTVSVDLLELNRLVSEYGRNSSLQGMLFELSSTMPLLSQLFALTTQRLDEWYLFALGRTAWGDDRHACELVQPVITNQTYDGPPCLRRRR